MIKIMSLIFICLMMTSCVTAKFTQTGTGAGDYSSNENCEFKIYTTPPKESYEEIGVLEFGNGGWTPVAGAQNIEQLRKLSQKQVCGHGGNGVLVWESNGIGNYKKATVIRVSE